MCNTLWSPVWHYLRIYDRASLNNYITISKAILLHLFKIQLKYNKTRIILHQFTAEKVAPKPKYRPNQD